MSSWKLSGFSLRLQTQVSIYLGENRHLYTWARVSHGSWGSRALRDALQDSWALGDAKGQAAGGGRQRRNKRMKEWKPTNLYAPNPSIFSFQEGNYQGFSCVWVYVLILWVWLNDSLVQRKDLYRWEAFTSIWYTNSDKKTLLDDEDRRLWATPTSPRQATYRSLQCRRKGQCWSVKQTEILITCQ